MSATFTDALLSGANVELDDAPGYVRRVVEVTAFDDADTTVGIFNYLLLVVLDDGVEVCLLDDGTVRYVTADGDIDQLCVGTWNQTVLDPPYMEGER